MRFRVSLSITLVLLLAGVSVAWADETANLAKELAALRGDVETLSSDLATTKTEQQDELRGLSRQKGELALELDREQIRLQKVRMTIAEKQALVDKERQQSQDLLPLFGRVQDRLRAYIASGLPFRVKERLAELEKVEGQLKSGLLTPQRAIARLWTMYEDEMRMTREHGLFRQTIVLDQQEQLADVARIGMVMLFFKTADGRVGHAYRGKDGWAYRTLDDPKDVKRVDQLFESFKKQIRVGYFELPNALSRVQ